METLNVEEVDHKQILNTGVRHPDNDPGRAVFIGPPQALQILSSQYSPTYAAAVLKTF